MNNDVRYFQFPLFLLRDLFIDHKATMDKIMDFSLYHYTKKMQCTEENVARQILYGMLRRGLQGEFEKKVRQCIANGSLDNYEGRDEFNEEGFAVDDDMGDILLLLSRDPEFRKLAYAWYRMKQSFDFYRLEGNFESTFRKGAMIENSIPVKEPFPMLNKKLALDFYENDKSETDLAQLAMYIAIHSILGTKPYCRTNKQMIVSRMFGYSSGKQVPQIMNPLVSELYEKYTNRYHFDKILKELQQDWHIVAFSRNIRGMFVGNGTKITLAELIEIALKSKKSYKEQKLRDEKHRAYRKALGKISGEDQGLF